MTLINGHICLPIPYKSEPPNLPRNFNTAKRRLDSLGRRLQREPLLRREYVAGILKNIEDGYAEWVTEEAREGYENYVPHHAVVTLKKPCRIVSDASSEQRGVSLNNSLHQGPLNTNMLVDVLVKFREGRYTLTGDIRSMFNQVLVPPEHCDSLRFLWWKNNQPGEEVIIGRMMTHTFGGGWCPSVASHALRMCADMHPDKFEEWIVETVRRNFYVDDLLKALHSLAQVIRLAEELPRLLAMNRFHLTKLGSNTAEVLLHIPIEERATAYELLNLDLDEGAVDHALGCILYPKQDVFGFKVGDTDRPMTRRGMLSVASSLFDPLGLLSPFVLIAKLLIQVLCHRGLNWDEPLPGEVQEQWLRWLEELKVMPEFTVARWLGETEEDGRVYTLHVFVDASSRAYGAAVYFCIREGGEIVQAALLSAKTRVAPLKTLSIPRLELNAALLGVRLEEKMREYLTCGLEKSVFWSDSMVVLRYLRGQPRDYKVAKILSSTEVSQWRHVPTDCNPADYVSRGMLVRDLMQKEDWINGPSFLKRAADWPVCRALEDDDEGEMLTDLELKRAKPVLTIQAKPQDIKYDDEVLRVMRGLFKAVSSWRRLVKMVLWLLRVKSWLVGDKSALQRKIEVEERRDAELEIMRWTQRLFMSDKHRDSPGFKKMFPFMEDNLCRVGGRLMLSQLRYEEKFPVFLPESHVADIYVQCVHEIVGHSGVERTYQEVHTRYWLIGGAEKDVKLRFDSWDQKRINERLGECGVTWEFNTPRASHHGGAWERMIRSFRNLFMAQAGLQVLSDDSLATFACAAEQIYNSRPLTRVSADPTELLPITPAHLLTLRPAVSLEGEYTEADLMKRRWKQMQGMAEQFWKRWSGNYLRELQRRYKWVKEERDFREGDIVLVHQDAGKRLQWPLGRVIRAYKGQDGHVRSVRVKMRDGEFDRPITKLVHLECDFPIKKT